MSELDEMLLHFAGSLDIAYKAWVEEPKSDRAYRAKEVRTWWQGQLMAALQAAGYAGLEDYLRKNRGGVL